MGAAGAARRLRGVVDNAPVLGALLGQMVAVARAVDVDADGGHGKPVEDRGSQGRVAQVLAPLAELDIRGDRGGGVFVPAVEQVEEDVRGGGLVVAAAKLAEADIVNDEPFRARPAAHPGFVGLIGEAGVQVVDQVDAAGVADLDLALAGPPVYWLGVNVTVLGEGYRNGSLGKVGSCGRLVEVSAANAS